MSATQPTSFFLADDTATTALGAVLAKVLQVGDTVLLNGPIGAGKTHLARAFIQAKLGRLEDVPSPTFTLVQTYNADGLEVWHADLYRLSHPDEVLELGLDSAFETAICFVEWPDRLGDLVPDTALIITLSQQENGRKATFSGGREGLLSQIQVSHGDG
ncbi:tRNA (adenosine(37)-N6)-threonylcarbamoyltransferase complex ATPase subunit type 1 TsaE [Pseudorhodobacter ferrugineus]|uniref:tRNA (adenosine(37)-N6)-threonylcarbamoyltransferase complex ATPase subunit type 1 TsaE n=1 Tax=Pseudorhodobacter ferrugineus TaxID=77008 RepID=UPI00049197F1|nr:tRNA (adenosine(37)-N6)-threonylcarbamoyltransferase complex ATPase subunit type 1 TsaE [Pseudorhodobacter ferrugineus]